MYGMANALLFAVATLDDKDPEFLDPPDQWKGQPVPPTDPVWTEGDTPEEDGDYLIQTDRVFHVARWHGDRWTGLGTATVLRYAKINDTA